MLSRVQVPNTARRGEVIRVSISIQHVMETGYRPDNYGNKGIRPNRHELFSSFR